MPRFICQGTWTDGGGVVVNEGTVTVYKAGGTTSVTIYEAATGSAASDNTVESDVYGHFVFWVDTEDYAPSQQFKYVLSKTSFSSKTYDNIVIFPQVGIWGGSGVYNFTSDTGAIASYTLGSIPDNSVITRAWYQVITAFASSGSATCAIGVTTNDANGIITATAFDDGIWTTAPVYKDGDPDGTVTNFTTQTTAERDVVFTIAGAVLTAGKVKVWWEYITGE